MRTLAGSSFARECLKQANSGAPPLDLAAEARLQALAVECARGARASAAHGVSRGGVLMAVAEMLLAGPPESQLGASLEVAELNERRDVALFDASPGIVFAVAPKAAKQLIDAAATHGVAAWTIGRVTSSGILDVGAGASHLAWDVEALRLAAAEPLSQLWNEELPR